MAGGSKEERDKLIEIVVVAAYDLLNLVRRRTDESGGTDDIMETSLMMLEEALSELSVFDERPGAEGNGHHG